MGARPQFIKAAAVSREFRVSSDIKEIIIHTGQHYDSNMSDVFFSELDIPKPHYHLGIGSGNHGDQTGKALSAIEAVLLNENPDWVLVYGDTNSTLAGALAAAKLNIPIAHIEAGLRSYNRKMPEEINRVLTDHVSTLLFPPSQTGVDNLLKEGISGSGVINVGDVMFDAALFYGERAITTSKILEVHQLKPKSFILATVHRAENTEDITRLKLIFKALMQVAADIPIIMPLHPRTRSKLGYIDNVKTSHLKIIDPVGYLDMVMLELNSCLVVTDSGGVQKEAFFHNVPCVTMREETEWTELIDLGWNRLAPPLIGVDLQKIILDSVNLVGSDSKPYGIGDASMKIVNNLVGHS